MGSMAGLVTGIVQGSGLLALSVVATSITPPGEAAITGARWTWNGNLIEEHAASASLQRREPRRVASVQRSEVPEIPRGTIVVAPEEPDAADQTWRVDAVVDVQATYISVVVIPEPA